MPLSTTEKLQDWLHFIDLLGRTEEPYDVVRAVIDEGIQAIGADGGFVSLLSASGTALEFAGSYAYPAATLDFLKTVPLNIRLPFIMAYNNRAPLFLESIDQVRRDYPDLVPRLLNFHGSAVDLPLLVADEALGVLMLSFNEPRTFSDYERTFLEVLAGQCAQALHRTRALHDERAARQHAEALQNRLSFLSAASTALNASLNLQDTLNALTRLAVPQLAEWCAVSLPDGDVLVPTAIAHQDESKTELVRQFTSHYPVSISGSNGMGQVFRTQQPLLIPVITQDMLRATGNDQAYLDAVHTLDVHSMIQVPLIAHGRSVGILSLASSSAARTFDQDDTAFALEIAHRAAAAVENAKLYEAVERELAQRTQAQAEVNALNQQLEKRVTERTQKLKIANTELKAVNANLEAFTYSVSHDLRAPIRHITSFTGLLQRHLKDADPRAVFLLRQVQTSAGHMADITQALLELATVTSQQLAHRDVALESLVHDVIASQVPDLGNRVVHWSVGTLPTVQGDERLLRQVLQNLLSNAVKYSAPVAEAHITVQAHEEAQEVIVSVTDNGVGFDPQFASTVFGVFQRVHSSERFEGIGVGLALVHRIVARHGGRVWAGSQPGQGATFSFALPQPAPGLSVEMALAPEAREAAEL
ncbi:ATP-binding protein [Deinococcus oregonensis]|uniref:histidine kinase n=1 Tax=Deinococcus oregonensis TaxID=1805970 RepID=A0ABV6B7C5_9DEIO